MSNAQDIQRLQNLSKSINNLVKMNLMQKLTEEPLVYVIPEILQLKDTKYMKNWCQNILRVWALTYKKKDVNAVVLSVFDKETGDLLCRYSEVDGLSFV